MKKFSPWYTILRHILIEENGADREVMERNISVIKDVNGNQIVIFYGSNSWSYTRLGRIDDLTGWEDALGSGDVTVIFSRE